MKSKPTTSNQFLFKQKKENFTHKEQPQTTLIRPTFYSPEPMKNNEFNANFTGKKNDIEVRIDNNFSFKKYPDYDMFCQPFFHGKYQKIHMPFFRMPMEEVQCEFQSRMTCTQENGNANNCKFECNKFLLNRLVNEKNDYFKEIKAQNGKNNDSIDNTKINDCNFFNYLSGNYNNNIWIQEKNASGLNMVINKPRNNNTSNSGTKFFTNHNYGYKCSCSKTQCNRKYCECFNSGNYCVDCNCKNCNNRPPANIYTNKHPSDELSKNKKSKIICTCTKSGCNKNYCECFKSGQKCSSLCRCISCENNDEIINNNNKKNDNFECCLANSIYIIKNNIIIESIKNKKNFEKFKTTLDNDIAPPVKEDFVAICKKRNREEKKCDNENYNTIKKINKNSSEVNLFKDSLFDNDGKVILRHLNLIHIK